MAPIHKQILRRIGFRGNLRVSHFYLFRRLEVMIKTNFMIPE
jgi:hypothetical protein